MKAKQLYFVLVAALVLLLFGFVGIAFATNKLLGGQATRLSDSRAISQALSDQQTTLAKNKKDITTYGQLDTIAETVVPQDKDQAEAVREIVSIASQSGIDKLSSITFPSSSLGGGAVATGAAAAGASRNADLTQLIPVKGMSGVYNLQITITQDSSSQVTYDQFTTFLSKLEQNRRTAQVSSISIQPDSAKAGVVAFTLVLNEFIKP